MVLLYLEKEYANQVAYKEAQTCLTSKWTKFKHVILFGGEFELVF